MAWLSQLRERDAETPGEGESSLSVSNRSDYIVGGYLVPSRSMLSNTLVTNEIKSSSGGGVQYQRISSEGRTTEFALIGENPGLPQRLRISHQEIGVGLAKRRRSQVRFERSVAGGIDTTVTEKVTGYIVLDSPIGNLANNTEPAHVLANLMSFCASLGASTTILYDGTGNGAVTLLSGAL